MAAEAGGDADHLSGWRTVLLPVAGPNNNIVRLIYRSNELQIVASVFQKKNGESEFFPYQSPSARCGLAEIQPHLCVRMRTPGTFGPTSGYQAAAGRL